MKFLIKLNLFCALLGTLQMVSGLLDPIDMIGRFAFASTTSNYRLFVDSTTHNYSYWVGICEGEFIVIFSNFCLFQNKDAKAQPHWKI